MTRAHAFTDDALGTDDASALAARIASGEVDAAEVVAAARARAAAVEPALHAVAYAAQGDPAPAGAGPLAGVPTYIKDNIDVAGMPTNHGSAAFTAHPAGKDGPVTRQLRATGLVVLGKSKLPEFGFNASTEYAAGESPAEPVHNPWDPAYSSGASSGGAAALVAAGVVPMAHANDGGGSIRIPAAACGLVGLKPTRGRLVNEAADNLLPVRIVSQGVVTRSVRDTAAFFSAAEDHWRNRSLPPVGRVAGPARVRLRVGVVMDSVMGVPTDEETRAAVRATADLLDELGHHVEDTEAPVDRQFADDFVHYWGMLGLLVRATGNRIFHRDFDAAQTDNLTRGLAAHTRSHLSRTPAVLRRLRRSTAAYREAFTRHDVVLTPVLGHTTPLLGHLHPGQPYEELIEKLTSYVGFTPVQNVTGGPAVSLPLGSTSAAHPSPGLPIGVQLAADLGAERTLLHLAYELEDARPFARIWDVS